MKQLLGERALPLSAPSGVFLRPLTPHRLPGKRCQSGVGRFLKVLGDANLTPIRRTEKTKPAEIQRVLCINLSPEIKLNSWELLYQKPRPLDILPSKAMIRFRLHDKDYTSFPMHNA